MSTTIEQIKAGAAEYIDKEVLINFPETSLKRIIGGASAAIFIANKANKLVDFANALGILNDDGKIELKTFKNEIIKRIGVNGVVQNVPGIGDITLDKDDVEKIYNYIVHRNKEVAL